METSKQHGLSWKKAPFNGKCQMTKDAGKAKVHPVKGGNNNIKEAKRMAAGS